MPIDKCQKVKVDLSPELTHWIPIFILRHIFFETIWPIELKFVMKTSWGRGNKTYANGFGHLIKKATMPIYGKMF